MKKSLARPILHDTLRHPLTQGSRYTRRNVYRIEQHLKLQYGAGLNGHSVENPGDHPVAVTVSSELDDLVDTLSPLIRADLVQSNANLFLATVGNNIAPRLTASDTIDPRIKRRIFLHIYDILGIRRKRHKIDISKR